MYIYIYTVVSTWPQVCGTEVIFWWDIRMLYTWEIYPKWFHCWASWAPAVSCQTHAGSSWKGCNKGFCLYPEGISMESAAGMSMRQISASDGLEMSCPESTELFLIREISDRSHRRMRKEIPRFSMASSVCMYTAPHDSIRSEMHEIDEILSQVDAKGILLIFSLWLCANVH